MSYDSRAEEREARHFIYSFLIVLLILAGIVSVVELAFSPIRMAFQRETIQQSREYRMGILTEVQQAQKAYLDASVSKEKALADNNDQLAKALDAQMAGAIRDMGTAFDKLGGVTQISKATWYDDEFRMYVDFFHEHQ